MSNSNYEAIDKQIDNVNNLMIKNKILDSDVIDELWRKFLFQYNVQKIIAEKENQKQTKPRKSHLIILNDIIADLDQPQHDEIKNQLKELLKLLISKIP